MTTQPQETLEQTGRWARDEFGNAVLGNTLRTNRLVLMASRAAESPAGRVTEVFADPAEREGAYRFVESLHVDDEAVGRAAYETTARRCAGQPFVFVAGDGCTLSVTDSAGGKGFGKVGTKETRGRGIEVMNAAAILPDGTPVGLCGQVWWTRRDTPVSKPSREREFYEKETRYWLKCIDGVGAVFNSTGVKTPLWFQLDAGADFRELLAWATETEHWVTVRAAQDRCVAEKEGHLWSTVWAAPVLGTIEVVVPRGRKRKPRTALLEVRSRPVTILLPRGLGPAKLHAVLAEEAETTPRDETPITWLLITNMPVEAFDEAQLVVYGYTQRWRVEDFHKSWKSVCRVEESQLEVLPFKIWATVLASVAMRVERLKHLARSTPDAPATIELTKTEIEAVVVLKRRKPKDYDPKQTPTIAQAVRWIAELGGYTGKQSGGPPGTIVIGRGLRDVEIAARVLASVSADRRKT